MKIETLAEGYRYANCYLLSNDGHAFLVDPAAPCDTVCESLRDRELTLDGILLTHGHFDHATHLAALLERYPVPLYLGEGDREFPSDSEKNAYSCFFVGSFTYPEPNVLLTDGMQLELGGETLQVLATPGHSPGSVCFYAEKDHILVTGDTLFSDTLGRFDLYGGSFSTLKVSLSRIAELSRIDREIMIYPGHGASTTLSEALWALPFRL